MATVHQSDLSSWMRCPTAFMYAKTNQPRRQSSALSYGSVIHHALETFERLRHTEGVKYVDAVEAAVQTFEFYWHPANIQAICDPVDLWLPRQGFSEMRVRGMDAVRAYCQLVKVDDHELLATEYGFSVPIDGTWDEDLEEPHILNGTIDRLAVRYYSGKPVLAVDDYKSGKEQTYLRQNLQFTAYCYATTKSEFWAGNAGEDGFGPERGPQLYTRFTSYPRRGTWINMRTIKFQDAGWRGPKDYTRFALAVEQIVASMKAEIYPLSLSGETCQFCFGGEVRFWTAEGVKSFVETAGTTQRVLVNTGTGGAWVEAPVRHYGRDRLDEVVLSRGNSRKTIRATPSHRWLVRVRADDNRSESTTVQTSALRPGDRLLSMKPRVATKSPISPIGVMAGVVYGDGCSTVHRNTSVVTLHGQKRELARYFPAELVRVNKGETEVYSLPEFMKREPDLDEARSYLLGWLAGYVATDGSVGTNGQVTLSSTNQRSIELARTVAARVGIATYSMNSYQRTTYLHEREYDTTLYRIQLRSIDLPDGFLLRSTHAARLATTSGTLTWTVVEVRPGNDIEDVYCVEVDHHENFVLEDWINVKNCDYRDICAGTGVPDNDHGKP